MNLLFVGTGSGGSWEVRGRQMAKAIGARATSRPAAGDWRWADCVILVKRAIDAFGAEAKKRNVPLVWDVLDYWQQPEENHQPIQWHIQQVKALQKRYGIATLIGATKQMADDIGGVYIPHHSRPGLSPTAIRQTATTVAYEGTAKYLGSWRKPLEHACGELRMAFEVNPSRLTEADVVVAFRGEQWHGEACQRWKSGVKYVNAIAAGRPVLTMHCSAAHEIKPFGHIVEHHDHVLQWLRALIPAQSRQLCLEASRTRAAEFSLAPIAKRYTALVQSTLQVAA
jgi:hypothetical protein